ncbi:olfactory receptor 56A4-like [Lissotriton helveticus]
MLVATGFLSINSTAEQVTDFILYGFPGFEHWQQWFSVPLTLLLVLGVIGNVTLIITIYKDQSLHEPMCYFLSMLSIVDLAISMVIAPKLLALLWFDARSISRAGCFTQMFFMNVLYGIGSGILAAMAFDRFCAICNPLRYTTILNNKMVVTIMVGITVRSVSLTVPGYFLVAQLNYCSDYIVKYPFCNHLAVTKLACDDISLNSMYQMAVANLLLGTDMILIFLSYCLILRAVLKLNAEGAIIKALGTCSSHLIVVFILYSMIIVLAITHTSKNETITHKAVILNVFLFNLPQALNPIVYGIRNEYIKLAIRKQFSCLRMSRFGMLLCW